MSVNNIRNIAFAGQAGAGKTTLIERLLFHTGQIPQMGEINRGSTVCDYDTQSKDRQHSLNPTVVNFTWQDHQVNVIDTPGMPDFIGRSISVLPAVESVAMVIDAADGPGIVSERLFKMASKRQKCRLIVVNRMDADELDLPALLTELQDEFGTEVLPINLPDDLGESVVDCYFEPDYQQPTLFSSVQDAHDALIDQVVEVDEALMEVYLEQGQELDPEQLHDPFEQALRSEHLIPLCFVSARTGAGIDQLLRVITELMPTPLEGNPPLFMNHDQPVTLQPAEDAHVLAHVFKVEVDPFMGRLAFLRVHQGVLTADSALYIGEEKKPVRAAHLFRIQGKEREEIPRAVAGDICAIAKLEELDFDCVLHDSHDEDHFHLQSLELPPPMFSVAIQPTRRGDEQKLSDTLRKITAEDPSLVISHRVNLNETLLTGVGELHLQVAIDRMEEQFKLSVKTSEPSIDYRETITKAAEGHYRHKKQTGGAGQFGEVYLRIRPLGRGEGFRFVDKVVGGAIPGGFIPAVEKGVRQIMNEGAIAGFTMQDIEVEVYDGKHHAVDSKEIAFVQAGRKAFLEAVGKASPIILEPVVDVQVAIPSDCMGDVSGDMASHRGVITDTRIEGKNKTLLRCKAPLSEMSDYSHRLKSLASGDGSFTMELSHFDPVPAKTQESLSQGYQVKELA
ncbi:elongation factor G [Reinekea blandensis]|uniref:Elongation factor G n=1 Tax=Reinekea blandensis MED297 TaxID=314283 RepID=A4BCQ5_9GAMM|nr:elongation factor G [Reinekea blandensis]EAR09987.1 Translation elongation factors (GTPase) [Reinekea sp. MED297] [Reinekea blandensis MED297]